MTLRCDHPECVHPIEFECACPRCWRERPDESFHACVEHHDSAAIRAKHERTYPGRALTLVPAKVDIKGATP